MYHSNLFLAQANFYYFIRTIRTECSTSWNTIVVKLAITCNNDDHKKLMQYLINENAYVDSTSFKDLEHVRIKADQKYHGIQKNTDSSNVKV